LDFFYLSKMKFSISIRMMVLKSYTVLIMLIIFQFSRSSSYLNNLPDLIKVVKPACVTIRVLNEEGVEINQGSGFFITPKIVVSSRHIFWKDTEEQRNASYGLIITNSRKDFVEYYAKSVVIDDVETDVIMVEVTSNENLIPNQAYLNITENYEEGEDIFVISSPYGLEGVISTGIISAIHNDYDVQISTPISMGSSGAPIINKKGEVVGIVRGSLINGQNLNFGIAMKNFRTILDLVHRFEIGSDDFNELAYPPLPFKDWVQSQNVVYTIDEERSSKWNKRLGSVISVVKDYTLAIFSGLKKNLEFKEKEQQKPNFKHWFKNSVKAITDGTKEKFFFFKRKNQSRG